MVKMSTHFEPGERAIPKYIWRDGEVINWEEATVHVFGINTIARSGIFEGIRAYWNAEEKQLFVKGLDSHINRLFNSARLQRMTIPFSKEEVTEGLLEVIRKNNFKENIYIRPNVYVYAPFGGESKTQIVITPFPRPSNLGEPHTIRMCVSSYRRISGEDMPPRAKAIGNYRQGQFIKPITKTGGWDEAILLTMQGKVSETTGANVGLIKDKKLITPALTEGVLPGVTRGIVLRLATDLGLETEERVVDRTELYLADEVFICGTGHGEVTPVVVVDDLTIGDGQAGPWVTKIRDLYHDIVRGNNTKYIDVVTAVYK
jgi:branched-chain amino acid aminotransferase